MNYVEVLSGLNGGEEVIKGNFRAVSKELEDGKKVKVDNWVRLEKETNSEWNQSMDERNIQILRDHTPKTPLSFWSRSKRFIRWANRVCLCAARADNGRERE